MRTHDHKYFIVRQMKISNFHFAKWIASTDRLNEADAAKFRVDGTRVCVR